MSEPKQSVEIALGYRVEPAENGGWILWDNAPPQCKSRMLGAFTCSVDLLGHLNEEHDRLTHHREARAAKERADQLGLEEHDNSAVDQWTPQERAILQGRAAPTDHFRMLAYAVSISGPERVPGDEFASEDYDDLGVARRNAILHCERGQFAFVYNDQGEVLAQVAP